MTDQQGNPQPQQPPQIFCSNCGGGNPPGAAVCSWCGKELLAGAMPSEQSQPAYGYPQQVSPPPPQYGGQYPYPPTQQARPPKPFPWTPVAVIAGSAIVILAIFCLGTILVLTLLGTKVNQTFSSIGSELVANPSDATPVGGMDYTGPAADLLRNGTQAPDFTLPANDGKTYSLSQFKGSPVLMDFMAPWCPHCQEDSQYLNQVYDTYRSKGLVMISINASPYGRNHENGDDTPITMDDQRWFADTFNVKHPMLFDAPIADAGQGHPDTKERMVYGVDYYPTIYVLDKNGVIVDHLVADINVPIDFNSISEKINEVLNK